MAVAGQHYQFRTIQKLRVADASVMLHHPAGHQSHLHHDR
jgi:hypothetical protein